MIDGRNRTPHSSGEEQNSPNRALPDRRRFLARLSAAAATVAALLAGVPIIGVLLAPARRQEPEWRDVGEVDEFVPGETVLVRYPAPDPEPWAGMAAVSTAWLRREGATDFVAFSPYCTHVGCPVTWTPGAELFMCPCHGGTYHQDGEVAGGPPPRPLDRLDVRVRNGRVELRTLGIPIAT